MLSVVIPTYRKPQLLRRTLEALLSDCTVLREHCEVVVVDDGSNDPATREVIELYGQRLPLRDLGMTVNLGRARARNRGWEAARGRWVLFLDDDIVLQPGSLRAHIGAQNAHPAAYLGTVLTDPAIVDSPLFAYLDSRGVAKLAPEARVPARYFLTQNVSVPRDALEKAGGFDEAFSTYGFEDMELAFRLEERCGLEFWRLPEAVGWHVHHHDLDEYLQKKILCGQHSLPLLAERHPQRLGEMRLDVLPGLGARRTGSRALLGGALRVSWRLGLPRLVRWGLRYFGRVVPAWIASRGYDYLVLSAYAQGLQRTLL